VNSAPWVKFPLSSGAKTDMKLPAEFDKYALNYTPSSESLAESVS